MSSTNEGGDGGGKNVGVIHSSQHSSSSMMSSSGGGGDGSSSSFQFSSTGDGEHPPRDGGQWRKYGDKLFINENGDVANYGGGSVSSTNENGRKTVFYNGRKVWSNYNNGE